MIGEFPGASYDRWKTRLPDSWDVEDDFDERADAESQMDAFEIAFSRDEVAPGFHLYGPFVTRVYENGDIENVATVVLPSRIGWEPAF